MCRHLGYVGPPVRFHDLVFAAPHSLAAQARCPRHQDWGDTNADGWGIGWYDDGRDVPALHLTTTPVWDDATFEAKSRGIGTRAFVAAARLASPGAAIAKSGNAPFREGRWLFSLNGLVDDFHTGADVVLRAQVSPERRALLRGDADTEVLFAMVLDRIDAGTPPAVAVAEVTRAALAVSTGSLNFLLTDGHTLVASRAGRSLFWHVGDGVTIVSEPLDDDPAWHAVPDHTVLTVAVDTDGPHTRLEDLE
jgi:glutamine amidotransferase